MALKPRQVEDFLRCQAKKQDRLADPTGGLAVSERVETRRVDNAGELIDPNRNPPHVRVRGRQKACCNAESARVSPALIKKPRQ